MQCKVHHVSLRAYLGRHLNLLKKNIFISKYFLSKYCAKNVVCDLGLSTNYLKTFQFKTQSIFLNSPDGSDRRFVTGSSMYPGWGVQPFVLGRIQHRNSRSFDTIDKSIFTSIFFDRNDRLSTNDCRFDGRQWFRHLR